MGRLSSPRNPKQVWYLHLLRNTIPSHTARQGGATAFHPIRTQHTTQHAHTPGWVVCTKQQFTLNRHGDIEVTIPTNSEVTPFTPEAPMPTETPKKAKDWGIGSILHSSNRYNQTNTNFTIIVRKTDHYAWFSQLPHPQWAQFGHDRKVSIHAGD